MVPFYSAIFKIKMKTVVLFLLLTGGLLSAEAQVRFPSLSPVGEIKQELGYTNFTIRYGRPSVRGRTIMGRLVPYGQLWRTGGGPATIISFDRDILIAGKKVRSGSYVLVTVPGKKTWTIMLNSDTSRLYVENKDYNVANEAVRLNVDATPFPYLETLTIIPEIVGNNLRLILAWENTSIQFDISTLTDEHIEERISVLNAERQDHESLAAAAYYFLWTGRPTDRALEMLDHALRLRKEFWYFETRMNLLVARGEYTVAQETVEEAVKFLRESKPAYWQDHIGLLRAQAAAWKKE